MAKVWTDAFFKTTFFYSVFQVLRFNFFSNNAQRQANLHLIPTQISLFDAHLRSKKGRLSNFWNDFLKLILSSMWKDEIVLTPIEFDAQFCEFCTVCIVARMHLHGWQHCEFSCTCWVAPTEKKNKLQNQKERIISELRISSAVKNYNDEWWL